MKKEIVSEECKCVACIERRAKENTCITFKMLCETLLSNDLVSIVEDIMRSNPTEIKPAYRYLLENEELFERKIDRMSNITHEGRKVVIITLK